jgi:hypothetical protein
MWTRFSDSTRLCRWRRIDLDGALGADVTRTALTIEMGAMIPPALMQPPADYVVRDLRTRMGGGAGARARSEGQNPLAR